MTSVIRRRSSGRCALIAIWCGVSAMAIPWPERAFGSTASGVQEQVSSQSGGRVLRSEVDLQTVNVQVKGKNGNDLLGLAANDFTVREDGKPQKIAFFDAGHGPVTVAVLVDSSSSVIPKGRLGSAEEVAARFMRIARTGDEVWAMDFTEWTGPFEQITAKDLSNPGSVSVPFAGGTGSAVYDAIASAICHLRGSKNPRQAIIVITDGVDEHSRLSLDQLIDVVRSQRAQLFLIGLPSKPEFRFFGHIEPKTTLVSGHDIDTPDVVFDRLAKEAGAQAFVPRSENGLQDALKAVSNLLESEYTLAYYPLKTSHKLRKIEVKVDQRGARVLTTRFLVANPDAAALVHYVEGACAVSPKFHTYPYESHVTNGPGGTVYRDDFSDPSSGWPEHPDSHYVPGGYELSTVQQESANTTATRMSRDIGDVVTSSTSKTLVATYRDNVVAAYGPSWRDFHMSANMRAVYERTVRWDERSQFSHPVRAAAGLVFRMNETGYYALLVGASVQHKQKLAFELVTRTFQGNLQGDPFAQAVIVPWTTVDQASATQAQLAVEDIGDQITIFVDGRQVGSARDGTFAEGYVGFMVSAPAHATFSNLVVEQTPLSSPATSVASAQANRSLSELEQAAATSPPVISAGLASTGNKPWISKPYEAWNDKDIQFILTQSPWVQKATIPRTWLDEKDVAPPPLISGGIRQWPRNDAKHPGDSPAVMIHESEASTSELNVYVFWDSSRVMRAAFARRSAVRGEIAAPEVEPYVRAPLDEYALVLTMADMTPFQRNNESFFQQHAFLELRSRKRQLSPSHVVYQKDAKGALKQVVFFFPKETPTGEPTITPDETDVEFRCQIGDSNLHVGFNPREMRDQTGPDL